MAKMSKAERKAAKQQNHKANAVNAEITERDLGYDADYFVDEHGNEIELVRVDFVKKPEWYYDMFRAKKIRYRSNELQALCSDGKWYSDKDTKSGLARKADGDIVLLSDAELKEKWTRVATSTSKLSY